MSPGINPPDPRPDPICRRISIPDTRFRLSIGPGKQRTVSPEWTPEQVAKLASVSPTLQAIINNLRAHLVAIWDIESQPREDGIDPATISNVLYMVATETSREPVVVENIASVLSQCSNVIWMYEIIPSKFLSCSYWTVVDGENTRNIIGALHMLPPLRPGLTHVTHHSHASATTLGDTVWCWSEPTSPYPYETALQLANCALVLGWQDTFKRAIKPVIWETRPWGSSLHTPVKYLKEDGPDGIKSAFSLTPVPSLLPRNRKLILTRQVPDKRRQQEDLVLAHLLRYLESHRKTDIANVEKTKTMLSEHGIEVGDPPSKLEQPSVYQLLRKIESALLPPVSAPEPGRRAHTRKSTHGSYKSSSSSGSNRSAPGPSRNPGPNRHDTEMTTGSSKTHKSDGHKRYSVGGPSSSSGSLPSSPPPNRPPGPSLAPLMERLDSKLESWISNSHKSREPRVDPEPDPARGARGGPARHDQFVQEMLREMHSFVIEQQASVAKDILDRRDLDVAAWEGRLL